MKSIKKIILAVIILMPAAKVYASASLSAKAAAYKTTGRAKERAYTASSAVVPAAAYAGQKTKIDVEKASHETQSFDLNSFRLIMPPELLRIIWGYMREYDIARIARMFNHGAGISFLAAFPDGRLASLGDDRKIKLWDTLGVSSEPIRVIDPKETIVFLTAFPDGRLASCDRHGKIKIWNFTDKSSNIIQTLDHGERVDCLAAFPDGRLASCDWHGKIKIWNFTDKSSNVIQALDHGEGVDCLAVLPDERLASAGIDGEIKIWNLTSSASIQSLYHGSMVNCLVVLPDGRLASGTYNDKIRIWDLTNNSPVPIDIPTKPNSLRGMTRFAVLSNGRLAARSLGKMEIWNPTSSSSNPIHTLDNQKPCSSLAALPDGRLASGDYHGIIRVWGAEAPCAFEIVMTKNIPFKFLWHATMKNVVANAQKINWEKNSKPEAINFQPRRAPTILQTIAAKFELSKNKKS